MIPVKDLPIASSHYRMVEQLYAGSRTLVYRGRRARDNYPVVIKLLRHPFPSFNELVQFRNQYTIAKDIDQPNIIKMLALEPHGNAYALEMEDFGGISLKELLEQAGSLGNTPQGLTAFFQIAIQIAKALDVLYHHRVIHKDLKPANILIHPHTKQVKLIDFSIASLLPRETQEIQTANALEGTLDYLSPEQTGRMNRGIDYRSDFYSLGVTFYHLLTGQLPFVSDDPMELVHCHLAKQPALMHSLNPGLPPILSEMVAKLMAKNAEDRYQSALGLKHDLEQCWSRWQATGTIEPFVLAQQDISDRFSIPEKLYGRQSEVAALLAAFHRVAQGSTELMLVAGFSGIGKTAIINEVHKPIARGARFTNVWQRGYFIKGKYDQFQRNTPFSAFVQAFRDLMGQLLSETDLQLTQWKSRILTALGENAQVILEVIPELKQIIGPQRPVPELGGSAAQNRFNLLFQKFIQVFTTPEHPLVMFLDDLQWADSASLKLMQLLMSESDTRHLLVIGAYRDNEVSPVHPLMLTVDEIRKAKATLNTITLAPLNPADLNHLIADTLSCATELALPLTQLVYQKTQGNPFFSNQFLKVLHTEELIYFDCQASCWQCDIAQVRAQAITDDVVEFMAAQLQKLPIATQDSLKLAACIGAQFDLHTLAIVSKQSPENAAMALWRALQEGLIIPQSEVYKFFMQLDTTSAAHRDANPTYHFLHDRVQQAAYSLIPHDQKQITHLQIGRLLQHATAACEQDELLFTIVNHLNQGASLIEAESEQQDLVRLNLAAGQKARSATAYGAALNYFNAGIALLKDDRWQRHYDLTLKLHSAAAEASYLSGDFEGMEQIAALVLQEAQTIFDKVKIYEIQIAAQTSRSQMLEALAVSRKALSQLGIDLPTAPDEAQIGTMLNALASQFPANNLSALVDLPPMSDPIAQAAMQLLGMLFAPVLQGMPGLLPFLSATMVKLSLQFGNAPASTIGYAIHGMVLCTFSGEVEAGYGFGSLALKLLEPLNTQGMKSIILSVFGAFIQHHQQAMRAIIPTLKDAYATGMETGEFFYAGYAIGDYTSIALFAGVDLDTLAPEFAVYSDALAQTKQDSACIYANLGRQTVQQLRETVSQPDRLIGSIYDETVMLPKHQQDHDLAAIAIAYIYKLLLAYCFGNYQVALDYITPVQSVLMAVSGMVLVPGFHFYAALTHLALFPTQSEPEQAATLTQVEIHQTTLHRWAQNAPMNHLHKWHLVEAERCRILGNKADAIDHYDRAIFLAKENDFLNEESLSNELAAKFYLNWGKEKIAQTYMTEAYYGYVRWGARAKVIDLETRYPRLLQPILQKPKTNIHILGTLTNIPAAASHSSSQGSSSSISDTLDFASIIKAAQSLSSTIHLKELLQQLTQIILQSSGADQCILVLPQAEAWYIKAISTPEATELCSDRLDDHLHVPVSLIQYVKRTQSVVTINNLQTDLPVIDDYLIQHQPKSILCLPILNQGQLTGILYLKNQITSGVFTSDRILILNFLCTQAAISLENAHLYQQSQAYAHQLEQSQLQIIQSEKMSALGNLVAGVAHEINNPLGFIAASLNQTQPVLHDIVEHLTLYQHHFPNPGDAILDHASEIDLDFSLADLPKVMDSMMMACDRLKNISTSLRTFSRADTDRPVVCNLHDGINSTLLILKYRLKATEQRPVIHVITHYGDIPNIPCFPGQLNQVFMNILANAIDVFDEMAQIQPPDALPAKLQQITICTDVVDNQVCITIRDNGAGMTKAVQAKIFDHLFTTKGVGQGTGLGLAIARQIIVEKHRGAIEVESTPGEGAEFTIRLPIDG